MKGGDPRARTAHVGGFNRNARMALNPNKKEGGVKLLDITEQPIGMAAMKKRKPAEEKEFIKIREKLQVVLLDRAQIRSTENVLEHFPQIIIAISVLTLKGAVMELELTFLLGFGGA